MTDRPTHRPGSEAEIKGYRPSYYVPYNGATPYESRVNQVRRWKHHRLCFAHVLKRFPLRLPLLPHKVLEWLDYGVDERPTFLTLYFEGVDTQGHYYGPNSVLPPLPPPPFAAFAPTSFVSSLSHGLSVSCRVRQKLDGGGAGH